MTRFRRWAVCSPLTRASEVGRDVLRDGGNAVDAAIATNLVLAVAYPHMCGVGGDLLAQVWDRGTLVGLNASGALPAAAVLPDDGVVPEHGVGSATVPGAPAGWCALAERFGTRPLRALAEPAIRLARGGVARSPGLARMTGWWRSRLEADAHAARIFLADELVQNELAAVLEDLPGFHTGPVAAAAPAPFTPADFAAQTAEWVEPLRAPFADVEVCELPHNSRGHLVLEALRRLEPLDGLTPDAAAFHGRQLAALAPVVRGGDTIYLTVVDGDGMAVSLNQSLFRPFGSGVVVPGTGVLLHNRGAFHTPASYRGGARPIHTLAPGMALRDGRPVLSFGTMGGEGQVQIHVQLLARMLVAGQDPQEAVAAPRWILERDTLLVEAGLPALDDVAPSGVDVVPMAVPDLAGHAHAIRVVPGGLLAGVDPRSDGVPVGD